MLRSLLAGMRGGYLMEENPYDPIVETLVSTMEGIDGDLKKRFGKVRPFNSTALRPEEEDLLYDNPAAHPDYADQMDEATGLPLTNAQAAQRWLMDDLEGYIEFYERVSARRMKEAPTDHVV